MKFIADFHIHSHFSRATSKKLAPEYLDFYAIEKGISVIGTGDFTHPGWLNELKKKKANVVAVDPYVEIDSVDLFEAVKEADAIVLMTQHSEFLSLDLKKIKNLMNSEPVFVECKRVYDKNEIKRVGFIYRGLGAGNSH